MSLLLLGAGPQVDRFVSSSVSTGSFPFLDMSTSFPPFTTVLRYNTRGTAGNGFFVGFTGLVSPGLEQFAETASGIQWTYNVGLNTVSDFEAHFPSSFCVIATGSASPGNTVPDLGDPTDVFAGGHG